jgi:Ca2+-binding EF-hand superfamily protein
MDNYTNPLHARRDKGISAKNGGKLRRQSHKAAIEIIKLTRKHPTRETKVEISDISVDDDKPKELFWFTPIVYSIALALVLVIVSFLCYESSRPLVLDQYQVISNLGSRKIVNGLNSKFRACSVLASQLSVLLGRGEVAKNSNNFTTFPTEAENVFAETLKVIQPDGVMVFFGSEAGSFIGYDISSLVALKDATTGVCYDKVRGKDNCYVKTKSKPGVQKAIRDFSQVVSNKSFTPVSRGWYVGAKKNFEIYKKTKKLVAYWSDVYLDFGTTDKFMVSVAYPVVDEKTSTFLGVVSIDIPIASTKALLQDIIQQSFKNSKNVTLAIIAGLNNVIVGVSHPEMQASLDTLPFGERNVKNALTQFPAWKDTWAAMANEIGGKSDDKHVISKATFTASDEVGLEKWSFLVITPNSTVFQYALDTLYSMLAMFAVAVTLIFFCAWLLKVYSKETQAAVLSVRIALYKIFNKKKYYVDDGDINNMKGGILITPDMYETLFVCICVGFTLVSISMWFGKGEEVITSQVNDLVASLSSELEDTVKSYLKIPLGVTRTVNLYYRLGVVPVAYNMSANDRWRSDTNFYGIVSALSAEERPAYTYIGTEDRSYHGVEMVPLSGCGVEFLAMENSTGVDTCTNTPFLKNYASSQSLQCGRNDSLVIPGKTFVNYDNRGRPWYTAAKRANGRMRWSTIYELITNPPTIAISAIQSFNVSGKLRGVSGADYTLDQLSVILSNSMNAVLSELDGSVGSAFIIEKSGYLVGTSSGKPITRTYKKGGNPIRIHATEICSRREQYPEECDDVILISYAEVSSRVKSNFFEGGLEADFPDGMEMEVGKGGELNALLTRVSIIDGGEGIDWILVCAFGKRSFLAKFERSRDLYQLIAFFVLGLFVLSAYLVSQAHKRDVYVSKHKSVKVDDVSSFAEKELDPESDEFFYHYRKLLEPSVHAANMTMRLHAGEPNVPQLFETVRSILGDHRTEAEIIFRTLDTDGNNFLSRQEFANGLHRLGYQATKGELSLLFDAIDSNDDGKIAYNELLRDEVHIDEPEATMAEKQRALEYVMVAQNKSVNIVDYLYLQRQGNMFRLKMYYVYNSRLYNYCVVLSVLLGLSLSFFEAPASALEHFTATNYHERQSHILALSLVSLLLYALDLLFHIWLFGVLDEDRTLKDARSNQPVVEERRAGSKYCHPSSGINKMVVLRFMLLFALFVDILIPIYTTGAQNGDEAGTQIIFLLPYTALLRPFWPILRFTSVRQNLAAFVQTLLRAQAVFFLFFVTLVVFSIMGTSLLSNRHSYDVFDSFQSIYQSFSTLFIYMASAENYPDVVYPPTLCTDEDSGANGMVSADCSKMFLNIYTYIASLWGTFLIISLVIAVFEDVFSEYISRYRIEDKVRSRMGIIAAFIILDKDGSGALEKTEFLTFLNAMCNTGRMFEVKDDFVMSGMDFIEFCEEFGHELNPTPMLKYEDVKLDAKHKCDEYFWNCSRKTLYQALYAIDIDNVPRFREDEKPEVMDYWRRRGADYYQEYCQLRLVEKQLSDKKKQQMSASAYQKLYAVVSSNTYGGAVSGFLLVNCSILTLYGAVAPSVVPLVDTISMGFVIFWFLEIVFRVSMIGFERFIYVNDDFFIEVRNRLDVFISLLAFTMLVVVGSYRPSVGQPLFHPWEACISVEECKPNDWTRIILTINAMRVFGIFSSVRKIVFCFYVIIPNYSSIIALTVLIIYIYAIAGCMMFGGTFKYLHGYDMGQANFNSMADSVFTLVQLFVGPAWNEVMGAGVNSIGPGAFGYFFSYTIMTTVLLTNLMMGVIISGYGQIVQLQKNAEERRAEKLSTKMIVSALQEGKINEPRLDFKYLDLHHVAIRHSSERQPTNGDGAGKERASERALPDPIFLDNVIQASMTVEGFYTRDSVNVILQFLEMVAKKQ